jgi:hypothetical protein
MRKVLVGSAALLVLAACAPKKVDPTPKPKPTIAFSYVELCVNLSTLIRFPEDDCGTPGNGERWVYVKNIPGIPTELPAIGQQLTAGRGVLEEPLDVTIGRVPPEGAYFEEIQ